MVPLEPKLSAPEDFDFEEDPFLYRLNVSRLARREHLLRKTMRSTNLLDEPLPVQAPLSRLLQSRRAQRSLLHKKTTTSVPYSLDLKRAPLF